MSYFYKLAFLFYFMKKSIEKQIENKLGKKAVKTLEKDIGKQIEKEVDKEVKKAEKQIEDAVEKRMTYRLYRGSISSALRFKDEFRKHTITAITAAFAFLIALSWRTPIQNSLNSMIINMGLMGKEIYVEYLSAILITIIAVLILMLISRWEVKGS